MSAELSLRLDDLASQLARLPEAKEPPPTTLQVLGRTHLERDWQRLLFHFLSPSAPHGLDHAVLEHFLGALSERDDLDFTYSNFDLVDVRVEQEVTTNRGRPDAVVWAGDEWFICWELKIHSTEGRDQTPAYADVQAFPSIGLDKTEVADDRHHYVYLAPEDAAPPEADEFVEISWEWVASQLQSFLVASHWEYPARTTAQLAEFIDTIRSELTVTEYQANQRDKAALYLDYYDEISEVRRAFRSRWEGFTSDWGTRLARTLEGANLLDIPGVPDDYVAVELARESGDPERWVFRQGMSDWGGILKEGWWKRTDDLSDVFYIPDDERLAGVSFYHRLEQNRDLAIEDRTLEIQFWHSAANTDEFKQRFNRDFSDELDDRREALPAAVELPNITDSRSKLFTARFPIHADGSADFFDAYTLALKEAFLTLAIKDDTLVRTIDRAYERSMEMNR